MHLQISTRTDFSCVRRAVPVKSIGTLYCPVHDQISTLRWLTASESCHEHAFRDYSLHVVMSYSCKLNLYFNYAWLPYCLHVSIF